VTTPASARALTLGFMIGLVLGCVEIVEGSETQADSETGDSCVVGSLGCACTPGGGCDPGLGCMNGACLELPDETDTDSCSGLGCACLSSEDCDAGLKCSNGACVINNCGNAQIDPAEVCDDGNTITGDGCDSDCSLTEVVSLALGGVHTCALIEGGRIRCWGYNATGQVGAGTIDSIGDDETPADVGDLPLPPAVSIAAGGAHTCAVFEDGDLRCWGFNTSGQLGFGNSALVTAIGDDEPLDSLAEINLNAIVDEVGGGLVQTCVRASGLLRCWGDGSYGQLGLANLVSVGDDELPTTVPPVMLGGEPSHIAIGASHGCAITSTGGVRCWGRNDSGQLGLMTTVNIGDDEHPLAAAEVSIIPVSAPLGTTVVGLGGGLSHTCALLSTGDVICWGLGAVGQLGQGTPMVWGDGPNESPSALAPVNVGGVVTSLAVGYVHNCVVLVGGDVRCWGEASGGQLGYADDEDVGLTDVPANHEPVPLGAPARAVFAGGAHTCAILEDESVMCWGNNEFGQLGYGFTYDIGDDEPPEIAGSIELL
jgi:cysteine-rich repeat protein